MVRRRVLVRGHVQGVYFRDSCRQVARALGVTGWVRNTDDLAVEAAFEGSTDAVDQVVEWCRAGPRGASVTDVVVTDEDPVGECTFEIRW